MPDVVSKVLVEFGSGISVMLVFVSALGFVVWKAFPPRLDRNFVPIKRRHLTVVHSRKKRWGRNG